MTSSGLATAPVRAHPLSTRVAIEGLGSFFIVFAGLGTALFSPAGSAYTVGFAYGLAMLAAIVCFGHVSNGYFNPAFSLGMAVAGRLKFSAAGLYIVAQTVGGILAAAVWLAMMKVMPADATPEMPKLFAALANGFDTHSPSQVPMIGVLIIELVAVGVLTAMLLGATSAHNKTTLGPVAVALAFAVAVSITMPLSNGSLNPARATSVVFLAESWAAGQLWLFWLAPLFGAGFAAAIYRSFVPKALPGTMDDADASSSFPSGATPSAGSSSAGSSSMARNNDEVDPAPAAPVSASDLNTGTGIGTPAQGTPAPKPAVDDAQAFFDGPTK